VAKLLPMQKKDFVGLFTVIKASLLRSGRLDPPLHEFFPHGKEMKTLPNKMGITYEKVQGRSQPPRSEPHARAT